jgi:gamma-glutamyltranspeptidase / glutathione hydrolase
VRCVVLNVIAFEMDAWFEGTGEHAAAVERLRAMGHSVRPARQGDAHTIWVDPQTGRYDGAADRRISGKAAGY